MFWPGNLSSKYTGTAQKQPFLNGRFSIAVLPLGSEGSKVAGNLLEMLFYFIYYFFLLG